MNALRDNGYAVFDLENEYGERKAALSPVTNKAIGRKIRYVKPWHRSYPASGETSLIDGQCGGWANNDGRWMGFLSDINVVIDLGEPTDIHYIGATFLQSAGPGIFLPERLRYQFQMMAGISLRQANVSMTFLSLTRI